MGLLSTTDMGLTPSTEMGSCITCEPTLGQLPEMP